MIKHCLINFLGTRIFYISLIITTYKYILDKYDLSGDLLFKSDNVTATEKFLLDFLKHFNSYDSIHFIHVAKEGYTNDKNFAFFPLFPLSIKYFSTFLDFVFNFLVRIPLVNDNTKYFLSGFIISNMLCFFNSLMLYTLAEYFTKSTTHAKIVSFLFLINPGTIFFISVYSENLYLCLQLLFLLVLLTRNKRKLLPLAVLILLLICTRSNSLFLCSHLIIPLIPLFVDREIKYDDDATVNIRKIFKILKNNIPNIGSYIILVFHALICFFWLTKYKPSQELCKLPLQAQNYTKYELYCQGKPSIYNLIQKEYWDVGFLSQVSFSKLDRIIMSLPMSIISFYLHSSIFKYFHFSSLFTLNLQSFLFKNKSISTITQREVKYNAFILSSFINCLALFFVVLFFAHPQINNRIFSACPVFYFFCTDEILKLATRRRFYFRGFLILVFFIVFSILSCLLQVGSYGFA